MLLSDVPVGVHASQLLAENKWAPYVAPGVPTKLRANEKVIFPVDANLKRTMGLIQVDDPPRFSTQIRLMLIRHNENNIPDLHRFFHYRAD